uniref:HIT domain-containing protein n=1 Tax=Poecilia mexicana TaxID=48701 RepID=A0A3B3WC42_9TELE
MLPLWPLVMSITLILLDIDPVAPHHYLVIPRDHIVSCKSLNRSHIDLVERMAKFGKEVLLDQGITDMENVRLGFHQPPFISVGHLHLHVLAPASQISTYMQHKFTPGTDRFITVRLANKFSSYFIFFLYYCNVFFT